MLAKKERGTLGRTEVDRHTDGNVAIVVSVLLDTVLSVQREVYSMGWASNQNDSFRGESLSFIRLSVMAIPNFLPMEYFPILQNPFRIYRIEYPG